MRHGILFKPKWHRSVPAAPCSLPLGILHSLNPMIYPDSRCIWLMAPSHQLFWASGCSCGKCVQHGVRNFLEGFWVTVWVPTCPCLTCSCNSELCLRVPKLSVRTSQRVGLPSGTTTTGSWTPWPDQMMHELLYSHVTAPWRCSGLLTGYGESWNLPRQK